MERNGKSGNNLNDSTERDSSRISNDGADEHSRDLSGTISEKGAEKDGATMRRYRIGYWMTEKKERRLNFLRFCDICRDLGIDIVKIEFDKAKTLEEQGPFDMILHKITDQVALTADGTVYTPANIHTLKKYLSDHPNVEVVDPIDNAMLLLDRYRQYRHVLKGNNQDMPYFIPSFVEFTSRDVEENKRKMKEQNVQFPFGLYQTHISLMAQSVDPAVIDGPGFVQYHGRTFIHCNNPSNEREEMAIVFNEEGLKDVEPPCVAQTFINHNARLFKIFIVGQRTYALTRPSIKNFYPSDEQKTIFFNSNDVSKSYSSSFLNKLDADELEFVPLVDPDPRVLDEIVDDLRNKLKLEFLGIDVIIENGTGRYAVIDINAFPGYDGVSELFPAILELICRRLSINHIDISHSLSPYGHTYLPADPSGVKTRILDPDEASPAPSGPAPSSGTLNRTLECNPLGQDELSRSEGGASDACQSKVEAGFETSQSMSFSRVGEELGRDDRHLEGDGAGEGVGEKKNGGVVAMNERNNKNICDMNGELRNHDDLSPPVTKRFILDAAIETGDVNYNSTWRDGNHSNGIHSNSIGNHSSTVGIHSNASGVHSNHHAGGIHGNKASSFSRRSSDNQIHDSLLGGRESGCIRGSGGSSSVRNDLGGEGESFTVISSFISH